MNRYCDGCVNVENALDSIAAKLESCVNQSKQLETLNWQDFVDPSTYAQDYLTEEDMKDYSNKKDSNNKNQTSNNRDNLQEYYHNLMVNAQKNNNKG